MLIISSRLFVFLKRNKEKETLLSVCRKRITTQKVRYYFIVNKDKYMSTNTGMELVERRSRRLPKTENIDYEYAKDEDQFRERSRTINHHTTTISVPHTITYIPSNRQSYIHVQPTIFIYNKDSLEEISYTSIRNIRSIRNNECLWIDIPGVHDEDLLAKIGERFKIHPLVLADIETSEHRTKLDILDDALFLVAKLIYFDQSTKKTCIEQICFYVKENILITFQQKPKDIFNKIKRKYWF